MAGNGDPVIRAPGEGTTVRALGAEIVIKATAAETGGAFGLIEYTAPPGYTGPPPHAHRAMVELFYVLAGELTMQVGDRLVVANPGTSVLVPPGTTHAFSNPGTVPVTFVGLCTPGGFESYFLEFPALVERHGYPPPPAVMAELIGRYDILPARTPRS